MGSRVLITASWYYSPDLIPIENAFAKLKALLRKAAARTRDTLWAAVATAIDAFSPSRLQNAPTTSPPPATTPSDENLL
jgi:hypothetical protein